MFFFPALRDVAMAEAKYKELELQASRQMEESRIAREKELAQKEELERKRVDEKGKEAVVAKGEAPAVVKGPENVVKRGDGKSPKKAAKKIVVAKGGDLSGGEANSSSAGEKISSGEKPVVAAVAAAIPASAHVASTDYVHPRFTHCERSYDYSKYLRKVAGDEDRVPDDTDYIVIDTRHHYSGSVDAAVNSAQEIREIRNNPEIWEEVPLETKGYFFVLRRKAGVRWFKVQFSP